MKKYRDLVKDFLHIYKNCSTDLQKNVEFEKVKQNDYLIEGSLQNINDNNINLLDNENLIIEFDIKNTKLVNKLIKFSKKDQIKIICNYKFHSTNNGLIKYFLKAKDLL